MNKIIFIIPLILLIAVSCDNRLTETLSYAGENRKELLKVIDHYSTADNEHKEAAIYIISNLRGHYGIKSIAMDSMISFIQASDTVPSNIFLTEMWKKISTKDSIIRLDDIRVLSAKDIIGNIEDAFYVWKHSSWKDSVNFDLFCEYILPHRIQDEEFSAGWRMKLRNEYLPLIEDETDILKAFAKIHNEVRKRFRGRSIGFNYIPSLDKIGSMGTGTCNQECAYETAVMRALGFPTAIDYIYQWGNYSNNGHSWCALVLNNSTYTVNLDDSIAKKFNKIDASIFNLKQEMPKGYPYTEEFKKRPVKVWRYTYSGAHYCNGPEIFENEEKNSHAIDVSSHYGLNNSVKITTDTTVSSIFLCTYSITRKWIPQTQAKVINNVATFDCIGDSVVLLPMILEHGKLKPIGLPFYISNGKQIDIIPDTYSRQSVTLTRKYPLIAKWLNRYVQIPFTRIEASNTPKFNNREVLYTITKVPTYHNTYNINSTISYQYFRIIADSPSHNYMARVVIYDINGEVLADGKIRNKDFGKSVKIGKIDYYPQNDGNFVSPGHDYQLMYWDYDQWKSIGRKISHGYEISFDNIPSKALLLLRDHSEGREERPFTLNGEKQVWW